MASRRVSSVNFHKAAAGDSTNSRDGSHNTGNGSTTTKKAKPAGKIVKSRYMQTTEKKPTSKNTSINQSISVVPRPGTPTKLGAPNKPSSGTPTRRSMAPQSIATPFSMMSSMLEPSQPGINVLQSTILDGHCFRPEFDVSSINEKAVMENAADPEEVKEMLENQTFLLAYLTSKIENNTQRLREEAERCLLAVMEEEERLRSAVQEKKRQFLLREKERQLDDLLDLQIAVLTPVVAAADQFKQQYKAFATAVDTTRHELPVHNVQMEGDRKEFLGRAETCLRETECLLREAWVQPTAGDQERAGSLLKEVKETAQEIDKELARGFADVLELDALVSQQAAQLQHSREEEAVGMTRAETLYFPRQ